MKVPISFGCRTYEYVTEDEIATVDDLHAGRLIRASHDMELAQVGELEVLPSAGELTFERQDIA